MEQYAKEAVRQGMELLQSHNAPLHVINLDALDTGHVSKCILACVYGSYGKGKHTLRIATNEAGATYGFWYPKRFNPREYYTVLTAVWKEVLKELM